MSEGIQDLVTKFVGQRNAVFEGMTRHAMMEGYAALSRETQEMGMRIDGTGLWQVDRLLAGGRVIGRVETWMREGKLGVHMHWLGEDPNSDDDEARRTGDAE
jgi:hypothetical protein